ncbi:hypothetical protein M011DRAFT_472394 [Sporormia fimetaria CBS 119925]|uniref:Transcription factor CBF/NF-Y/archaeal histone domain-containing protein n=1 Tax=Sporormia fimetaria CBS 119925 TaxID=1340428 RepID=A0A6A6UWN5_9PLEO|nr:hypothetical protein M011DRAFT_472394 [Sporormia fimetaria CBS 119925]
MPYNNTPIPPSSAITGQTSIPFARVQKIIAADPDRTHLTKNAQFAIALATEMFIQHLSSTTHNVVKAERKPRRNLQYRDVAAAVAKTDNLEFLTDVVPKTQVWKEVKERLEKKKKDAVGEEAEKGGEKSGEGVEGKGETEGVEDSEMQSEPAVENGQAEEDTVAGAEKESLTGEQNAAASDTASDDATPNDAMEVDEVDKASEAEQDEAAMQIEMEMRGGRQGSEEKPAPAPAPKASGFTAVNGNRGKRH